MHAEWLVQASQHDGSAKTWSGNDTFNVFDCDSVRIRMRLHGSLAQSLSCPHPWPRSSGLCWPLVGPQSQSHACVIRPAAHKEGAANSAPAKSVEKFRPAFTRIISARLGQRIKRVKRGCAA